MDWSKLLALLSGKKTYLAAGLAALWPILAPLLGFSGELTEQSVSQILLALAIAALRAGVANAIPGIGPLIALLPQLISLLRHLVAHGPQLLAMLEKLKAETDKVPAPAPAPNFDAFATDGAGVESITAPSPDRPNPSYRLPLILLALMVPAAAQAAPIKAVLIGPATAEAGSDVFLDASQSEGEPKYYLYRVTPELTGRRQIVTTDKLKPRILTYPGTWNVELIVVSEEGEQSRAYHTITIPGSGPCPTPEPNPRPTPTPIPQPNPPLPPPPEPGPIDPAPPRPAPPAGEFGIAPQLYALAKSVGKPADCKLLADKLAGLAAKCDAGAATMQAVLNELAATLATLGPEWSGLKTAAKPALLAIHMAGKLPDVAALSRLLKEMESAFRAAVG